MHCIYKERNLAFSNTNSMCGHMNVGGWRGCWEAGRRKRERKNEGRKRNTDNPQLKMVQLKIFQPKV